MTLGLFSVLFERAPVIDSWIKTKLDLGKVYRTTGGITVKLENEHPSCTNFHRTSTNIFKDTEL